MQRRCFKHVSAISNAWQMPRDYDEKKFDDRTRELLALVRQVLQSLNEPALFWLDAGYFIWAGEHKSTNRLMEELDAIFRHPVRNHVVLIDDVVSWGGRDGTPEATELEREIVGKYPERTVTVESGLMCVRHKDYF